MPTKSPAKKAVKKAAVKKPASKPALKKVAAKKAPAKKKAVSKKKAAYTFVASCTAVLRAAAQQSASTARYPMRILWPARELGHQLVTQIGRQHHGLGLVGKIGAQPFERVMSEALLDQMPGVAVKHGIIAESPWRHRAPPFVPR